MTAPLSILAPTRYPWRFNGPRASRHRIDNRSFAPFNRINFRIEGITAFAPLPLRRFDLIHAFNRIPIGRTPYLIGFESHLPRAYTMEGTAYFRALQRSLASSRCRGVVAISQHAADLFRATNAGTQVGDACVQKLEIRYPNIALPPAQDEQATTSFDQIRVTFIGSHFARKGGLVAIRLAELAHEAGLPIRMTIVSDLQMGPGI